MTKAPETKAPETKAPTTKASKKKRKKDGWWRKFRFRLENVGYRAVTGYLGGLPPARVRRFGHWLGRVGRRLVGARYRLAVENIAHAFPELEPAEHKLLADRSFEHLGGYFCELTAAWRWDFEEMVQRFDLEGFEHLEEVEARGRGYILFSGHLGFWELGTYPLAYHLGRLHLVARTPSNPEVARDVEAIRRRIGHEIVDRRRGAIRMRGVLRDGGRLVVTADQHIHPKSGGTLIPFLGRPASTTTAFAFLSRRLGVPAVPIYCYPVGADRYRLLVRPPIEATAADNDVELTRLYLADIEAQVRAHPEQWLWPQRLWR